jgi:exodeoxyribonuclease VII large subunit
MFMSMEERKIYTLKQVGTAIKHKIDEATQGQLFWVSAEIASIKVANHAYLELVQHEHGNKVAVMRGVIWGSTLQRVQHDLGDAGRHILKDGVETLFLARPNYHLVYGLSLVIEAIDPTFTISALERRKQETIATLKAEDLYDRNRALPMPIVVQRIALVASKGSAAYADFMRHLEENEHGFRFHVHRFDTNVQGDAAAQEMRAALEQLDPERYDVAVLIRGGGSRLDLEPFNDLELARAAARLPIPVLTGIGHDVDISVLDLIAHGHHKTPTAVADWIVDRNLYFESGLTNLLVHIHNAVLNTFAGYKEQMSAYAEMLAMRPVSRCRMERGELHNLSSQFARSATTQITRQGRQMELLAAQLGVLPRNKLVLREQPRLRERSQMLSLLVRRHLHVLQKQVEGLSGAVQLLSPDRLLERGFSITRKDGRALRDARNLKAGDEVETTFARGKAWGTITRTEP